MVIICIVVNIIATNPVARLWRLIIHNTVYHTNVHIPDAGIRFGQVHNTVQHIDNKQLTEGVLHSFGQLSFYTSQLIQLRQPPSAAISLISTGIILLLKMRFAASIALLS